MNHNNEIRASRLHAETSQFADWLYSQIGRETSSKIGVPDFQDRICGVIEELPTQQRGPLSRLLEQPLSEMVLSYQEGSKLDRLLREWAEIAQSERGHMSDKLRRITNIVRPVVEEMRAQLIAQAHDEAEEARARNGKHLDRYIDLIKRIGDDHPEFAKEVAEALQTNPSTSKSPHPWFKPSAEQQPFSVDVNLLLQPFRDAINGELMNYEEKCDQRSTAAWEAMVALDKLVQATAPDRQSTVSAEGDQV